MMSREVMTKILCGNFEKSFFRVREIKMAASNQERFTLATDDTIEKLRNGSKNATPAEVRRFG